MRNFRSLLAAAFFLASAFLTAQVSFTSAYSMPKRLYVKTTKYFDFIYPAECRETAANLAETADEVFDELCDKFGLERRFRMPVVISSDTDENQAYFMPIPYNRIMLFDASPVESDMSMWRGGLREVFRHELVHAVTLNLKSKFWRGLSIVTGDAATRQGILALPPMFIEGTAVMDESDNEIDGRLNDAQVMQILTQMKAEKRLPTWQEVSGASDRYPSSKAAYLVGGAFCKFMQQKYGLSKFCEYWAECGKPQVFKMAAGAYKKVFKTTLAADFNQFCDAVEVPKSLENSTAKEIFKGRINAFDAKGSEFVFYDAVQKYVFLAVKNGGKIAVKKLFPQDETISRLSLSESGRFVAVSSRKTGTANYEYHDVVWLYDVKSRRFETKFDGLRDAVVSHVSGDEIAILAVEAEHQHFSLFSFKFDAKTKERYAEKKAIFGEGEMIASPVFLAGETLAFILHDATGHHITLQTGDLSRRLKFENLPDGKILFPRFLLNCDAGIDGDDDPVLNFSWNTNGQTGHGILHYAMENGKVQAFLQHSPPLLGAERSFPIDNEETVYVSRKFYEDAICTVPAERFFYDAAKCDPVDFPAVQFVDVAKDAPSDSEPAKTRADFADRSEWRAYQKERMLAEKKRNDEKKAEKKQQALPKDDESLYNPLKLKSIRHGLFLPLAAISSVALSGDTFSAVSIGATYFQMTPTEASQFLVSSGYHISETQPFTSLDSWNTCTVYGNSMLPVKQTLQFSAEAVLDGTRIFQVQHAANWQMSFRNNFEGIVVENTFGWQSDLDYHEIYDTAVAYWTNFRTVRKGAYSVWGFQAGGQFYYDGTQRTDGTAPINCMLVAFGSFALPRAIPIENTDKFTFNLPLRFNLQTAINQNSEFIVGASVRAFLFSVEIQRALSFFPLFFNRATLEATYSETTRISRADCKIFQAASVRTYATVSPILGEITGRSFDLGVEVYYDISAKFFVMSLISAFRF